MDKEVNLKSQLGELLILLGEHVEDCIGFLWSTQHIVLVRIASGTLSHSEVIPLDVSLSSALPGGLAVLAHYLSYDSHCHEEQNLDDDSRMQKETLPFEILSHILGYTDAETYRICATLSRSWRAYCLARSHIGGPYMLLSCSSGEAGVFTARKSNEPSARVKVCWNRKYKGPLPDCFGCRYR